MPDTRELLDQAVEIIRKNAETFREYERLHKAKGTPDGDIKAMRNQMLADAGYAFLSRVADE